MNNYIYKIENKKLVVVDKNSALLVWKGRPGNMDVVSIIPVEQASGCIVLLDWLQAESLTAKNLLRIDHAGQIVWEIRQATVTLHGIDRSDTEIYVKIEKVGDDIFGTSALGFIDKINIQTGEIIDTVFVK